MNYYLTSDTHFNHPSMFKYGRPANYEDLLFKSMLAIPRSSVLIHLGDISNGKEEDKVHETYIIPLKCKKWLVRGNHDKKSDAWYLNHGWDFIADRIVGKYFGTKIVFTHIPIAITELLPLQFNVHGHLHDEIHRGKKPSDNHLLVSSEYLKYQVISLEKFLFTNKPKYD